MRLNLDRLLRIAEGEEEAPEETDLGDAVDEAQDESGGEGEPGAGEEPEQDQVEDQIEEPEPDGLVFNRPAEDKSVEDPWDYEDNMNNPLDRWGGELFSGLARKSVIRGINPER